MRVLNAKHNNKLNTHTTMNFEQTIKTLLDWQEENEEGRCFVCLIADKDTNDVQAAAGGLATIIAGGLAAMVGKLPHFEDVLQAALNLYARRLNDKAVEKFIEKEETALCSKDYNYGKNNNRQR